jgi:hypothetical protein
VGARQLPRTVWYSWVDSNHRPPDPQSVFSMCRSPTPADTQRREPHQERCKSGISVRPAPFIGEQDIVGDREGLHQLEVPRRGVAWPVRRTGAPSSRISPASAA